MGDVTWRETVREAARQAAEAEATAKGSQGFNYRWEHVQAVVRLARWLAQTTGANAEVVAAAAWLHDVAKLESQHAKAGAQAAQRILAETDYPASLIPAVAEAIANHEGLFRDTVLEPLAAAVLWDADKLAKLGATGWLHMLVAGFALRPTTEAILADQGRWIDQFGARIVTSMNTEPGRAEAARRLETMRASHAALARELSLGEDTRP